MNQSTNFKCLEYCMAYRNCYKCQLDFWKSIVWMLPAKWSSLPQLLSPKSTFQLTTYLTPLTTSSFSELFMWTPETIFWFSACSSGCASSVSMGPSCPFPATPVSTLCFHAYSPLGWPCYYPPPHGWKQHFPNFHHFIASPWFLPFHISHVLLFTWYLFDIFFISLTWPKWLMSMMS